MEEDGCNESLLRITFFHARFLPPIHGSKMRLLAQLNTGTQDSIAGFNVFLPLHLFQKMKQSKREQ